jgi:NAD+ kinase
MLFLKNLISRLQGISVRWRDRESYSSADVEWADAIFAAGGDGNFLFASSKVLTDDKIVIGLNTDPSWSEGYLCLCPSQFKSLTDVLRTALAGDFPVIHRWRIRVRLGDDVLPVRALNEVFVGEKNLSQYVSFVDMWNL